MSFSTGPCLGCMFFGTTVPSDRAYAVLDRYVERGGRLLDTANNYAFWADGGTGDESEELLGRWLAERGLRNELLIATKIGARPKPGGGSTRNSLGLGAGTVREQLTGSLSRLGIERVDLLYAHIDDHDTPLAETLGAFDALVRDGLVDRVAVSNFTVDRLQTAIDLVAEHEWTPLAAVQLRATYVTPAPGTDFGVQIVLDDATQELAAAHDITVFGYSALLGGAYSAADRPLPADYQHAGTDGQLAALRVTATRLGITVNQVVLGWLANQDIVPVLGASWLEQLDEALDTPALDAQAVAELAAARHL